MASNSSEEPVEKPSKRSSDPSTMGMVRFTEWAEKRVVAKRKRRGLGELKPRKKHAWKQIINNGMCLTLANGIVAPLERCRILLQTAPMSTYRHELPETTRGMVPYIIKTQGQSALWRGAMPHIYKQWMQVVIKVAFYDRIKHAMMPYRNTKYTGLDLFIRSQSAAIMCMGLTTALTYPFDTLHTRLVSDSTPLTRKRTYSSTFQCFNRTNIEEGRFGCFKGLEFAVSAAVIRAMLHMPVYDMVKWSVNKTGMDGPDSPTGTFMQRMGASLISGTLLACILYPLDTFKRNSQLNGGIGYRLAFNDPYQCTQYVFKESKGNLGLYKGCSTFFVSQVMLAFIQFSTFDFFTGQLRNSASASSTDKSGASD